MLQVNRPRPGISVSQGVDVARTSDMEDDVDEQIFRSNVGPNVGCLGRFYIVPNRKESRRPRTDSISTLKIKKLGKRCVLL